MSYHSGMHEPVDAPPVEAYADDHVLAFRHDLAAFDELPDEYDECDVIYGEVPWKQRGIEEFMARRGEQAQGDEWARFTAPLARAIQRGWYVVLVGPATLHGLGDSRASWRRVHFVGPGRKGQGVNATLTAFNGPLPGSGNTLEVLAYLAQERDHVGDPMCGYGNTGKAFVRAGKRATLSDADPRCIGHIAETAKGWSFGL